MAIQFDIALQSKIDASRIAFHALFMQGMESNVIDPVAELYQELQSSTPIEDWSWLGDLPGFTEWKGDRQLSEIDAFNIRIVNKDWASGLRLHQHNIKDDQLGMFQMAILGLVTKARRHRSDLMVRMLLNGFTGTLFPDVGNGLAYDGSLFFSTSHPTTVGGTQSNKITSALDATSLETAITMLRNMTTADGKDPLELSGTHLVVGPANEWKAKQLLNNDLVTAAIGANAGAAISNVHKNTLKLIVSNRIRGAPAGNWFLSDLSVPGVKPGIFQMREEIQPSSTPPDSEVTFKRGELYFGAQGRYNVAPFAWQTTIGSNI